MTGCLNCAEPVPHDAILHQPELNRLTGETGWYIADDITYCPTCMAALIRGLPPIGARSPQR